ncbi:hypothetical protein VaNZ11_004319 [Volvox africanus]|uniref:Serine aminopeptidase S33 domain-containing protein n=1 Tax=Volvox africanus TaxID=51714 RepID=A0ABQ5RW44_9CHLO|nr:hypothetical protein VaNZ11_004319 [Volvox africanus]
MPYKTWGHNADHPIRRLSSDLCCRMHLGTHLVMRLRLAGRSACPPLLKGPASCCIRYSSILHSAPEAFSSGAACKMGEYRSSGSSSRKGQNQDLHCDLDSELDDSDRLDIELLPLRWLSMDGHEAASVAYRHYLPVAPSSPPPLPSPRSPPPPLLTPSCLSLDTSTQVFLTAAAAASTSVDATGGASASSDNATDGSPDVCVFYCNGLKSHMTGAKVRRVLNIAATCNCEFLCFDYTGFGASTGRQFQMCGLRDWIDDAAGLMTRVMRARKVVLIGSSIGGWVALRLAQLTAQASEVFTAAGIRNDSVLTTTAGLTTFGSLPANNSVDNNTSTNTSMSSHSGNPAFPAHSGGGAPVAGSPVLMKTRSGIESPGGRGTQYHCGATLRPTIASLLLIAPAVDISEVRWAALTEAQQRAVTYDNGLVSLGSPYRLDGGDLVGLSYFLQGRRNLLHCPEARMEPLVPGVSHLRPLAKVSQPQGHNPRLEAAEEASLPATNIKETFMPLKAAEGRGFMAQNAMVASPQLPSPICPGGGEQGIADSMEIGVPVGVPVVILHGSDDEVVPIQHAEVLVEALNCSRPRSALAPASFTLSPERCEAATSVAGLALGTSEVAQSSTVAASSAGSGARSCNLVREVISINAEAGSGSSQSTHGNLKRMSGAAQSVHASLHVLMGGDHRSSSPEGLRMLQGSLSLLIAEARRAETGAGRNTV